MFIYRYTITSANEAMFEQGILLFSEKKKKKIKHGKFWLTLF